MIRGRTDGGVAETSALAQPGTLTFITWRTWDSMPATVVRQWLAARDDWLRLRGVDPPKPGWEARLNDWPARRVARVSQPCLGSLERQSRCAARLVSVGRPELAQVVAKSLHHGDGQDYWLSDFVVMPNHIHLLATFATEEAMLAQCESWKHFTAREINRALGRFGRFWEQDAFDHLIRSPEELAGIREYIANNPKVAKLKSGEYLHYRRDQ